MAPKQGSSTRNAADGKGFTAEEKAAMRQRAKEMKAEARSRDARADGERDLLAAIEGMPAGDRAIAERLHGLIMARRPELAPKTWYGMPAWALDGKVVCFFQPAEKFKSRYATFGFSDEARIDEGTMWPTSFGLTTLTSVDEARIAALVDKAVG